MKHGQKATTSSQEQMWHLQMAHTHCTLLDGGRNRRPGARSGTAPSSGLLKPQATPHSQAGPFGAGGPDFPQRLCSFSERGGLSACPQKTPEQGPVLLVPLLPPQVLILPVFLGRETRETLPLAEACAVAPVGSRGGLVLV